MVAIFEARVTDVLLNDWITSGYCTVPRNIMVIKPLHARNALASALHVYSLTWPLNLPKVFRLAADLELPTYPIEPKNDEKRVRVDGKLALPCRYTSDEH